jgi:hypothetical protein
MRTHKENEEGGAAKDHKKENKGETTTGSVVNPENPAATS